jgi:hypothetical protein
MPAIPSERAQDVREALRLIVSDREHGAAVLSNPQTMSNLLKDLLPDAPREKNLLVAAAEAGLAGIMSEHVAQGIDASSAIRLAASSFGTSTHFTADACTWVATQLAVALDLGSGLVADGAELPAGDITVAQRAGGTGQLTEPAAVPAPARAPAVARAGAPLAVSAVLVLAGAAILLLAYVLPVVNDPQPVRILTTLPFYMASFPLIALVVVALSGVLLLRRRGGQLWRVAAGAATAISGVELLVFFAAVNEKFVSSFGDRRGFGLVLGVLGALLLIAGGVMELTRQVRLSQEHR